MTSSEAQRIGPVVLQPRLVERVWGTDDLGVWYPAPEAGKLIGEVWLTAEECIAESGPHAGKTLKELAASAPEAFANGDGAGFPLLMKLLYPREKLSVQVHPDNMKAQAIGQPRGKTECWYVLSAEPGAQVALGFREELSGDDVARTIQEGSIEDKLRYLPVKAGDLVYVDAGTVHAIGPGIVVLETQQYSDVTYRLWDYGRPRELHIKDGLAATRTQSEAGMRAPVPMDGFTRLVTCPYFTVDRFSLMAGEKAALGAAHEMQVLVALGEGCTLESDGEAGIALQPGRAVVLPAEGVPYRLAAASAAEVARVFASSADAFSS